MPFSKAVAFKGANKRNFSSITATARANVGSWSGILAVLCDSSHCIRVDNTIACADLMSECAKQWQWQMVFRVLTLMRRKRVATNKFTYSVAMSAFSKSKRWRAALEVMTEALHSQIKVDTILCSTAISACGRGKQWQVAVALLAHMLCISVKANVVTLNAAITACEKGNRWRFAIALLTEMESFRIAPDITSFSAAISACEKRGKWAFSLQLLRDVRSNHINANVIAYSAVISACATGNEWERALMLLRDLESCDLTPNTITCSSVVSACGKDGQWEAALVVWESMEKKHIPKDVTSFNAVISACDKGLQWRKAVHMFETMVEANMGSDPISFYSAMRAVERCGKWELAMDLISAMLGQCVSPEAIERFVYTHHVQAGSVLDCFKHVVLIALLQQMLLDGSPLTYLETHSGAGVYDLDSPQALSHGKADHGVKRLHQRSAHEAPSPLSCYMTELQGLNAAITPDNKLRYYFGSPVWALRLLRSQDKAILIDIEAGVCNRLRKSLASLDLIHHLDVHVVRADAYRWLTKSTHSVFSGRGLVFIDPPYDSYESYTAWNLFMLRHLWRLWPTCCIMLWYPSRNEAERLSFFHRVQCLRVGNVLVAEFDVENVNVGLSRSGIILVNPPLNADGQLKSILPDLGRLLSPNALTPSRTAVFWLSGS